MKHELSSGVADAINNDAQSDAESDEIFQLEPAMVWPVADSEKTEARYGCGRRIHVREKAGRFTIWHTDGRRWWRQRNFATFDIRHARVAVEELCGKPMGGWHRPADRQGAE